VPVLAADTSALPEVLGNAALLVNAENVFELARGIEQIVTDDFTRLRLVAAGTKLIQKYSWERSAAEVLAVYESVVRNDGSRPKRRQPENVTAAAV
jgi:glycosyltransferase involved in cell wall biosynthesis